MSGVKPVNSSDSDSDDSDEFGLESLFQVEKNPKRLSFDMWGWCRADNWQQILEKNQRFKPARVYLMKLVIDYLNSISVNYYVYGGTALSVYREGGKIIEHDGDIDVAIMETDFANVVKKIDSCQAFTDGEIVMEYQNINRGRSWFDADGTEIPFNGCGAKRIKFFATKKLLSLQFGIPDDELISRDLVHLDVFTLSQHPDFSDCFCVNWNIPGHYDYRKKAFPKSIFFPLKKYSFEGLGVTGMNDLKTYLELEYGYIGRGAIFDQETQLYVKIPENICEKLPKKVQRDMILDS